MQRRSWESDQSSTQNITFVIMNSL